MHGFEFDIERIRAFKESFGLTNPGYARLADMGSHVTVSKIHKDDPELSLRSLKQMSAPLPTLPAFRFIAFQGRYSINRKIILPPGPALQKDRELVRSALAANMLGKPLDIEEQAYHIVAPAEPIEESTFARWQPVKQVDGGYDFTACKLSEVPDPAIRAEFVGDVQAVLATLSPQFGVFNRLRINPSSGEVTYRLFMRVMIPYVGPDHALRVFVVTRPQKLEPTLRLYPDLRLPAPDQCNIESP